MLNTLPLLAALPQCLPACAACLGAVDSRQTQGMNVAVLFLLGVVLCVLSGLVLLGWRLMAQEQRNASAAAASLRETPPC